MLSRIAAFLYGVVCYFMFLVTILYAIGFIGNFAVPRSIDSGPEGPWLQALAINCALLTLFAVQHSVMARQWFKAAWTKVVPRPSSAALTSCSPVARSCCCSGNGNLWEFVIWDVDNTTGQVVLQTLFACGWLLVFSATFLINHFDLFGLRQVVAQFGRTYSGVGRVSYTWTVPPCAASALSGISARFWAAPVMTLAHLVFAIATTGYILVAIQLEERDLVRSHKEYADYRRRVPMILPLGTSRGTVAEVSSATVKQAG